MSNVVQEALRGATTRFPLGVLLLTGLMLIPSSGRATEFIPSLGINKATDALAGDATYFAGIALRAPVLPLLKLEGGISYRQDKFPDLRLKVRMWPVTVSGWFTPLPGLYAGGGLGWYRTTYDYTTPTLTSDRTTNQVGVHLGGGVRVPLAPRLGLDLNGRYVFLQKNNEIALPSKFNPDFWSASLGVAFQF